MRSTFLSAAFLRRGAGDRVSARGGRRLGNHGATARRRERRACAFLQHAADGCYPYRPDFDVRPISGAHFNPAVSAAFALRARAIRGGKRPPTSWRKSSAVLSACGWRIDVRAAAVANIADMRAPAPDNGWRNFRYLRTLAHDPRLRGAHAGGRSLCGRPVHHRGLLVHGVHFVC